ncbi:MAG: hypothetical protein LBS70_01610, partial [Candidatus Accumulibacter sp.]|nr:hypothetical protein [Accumulibacter sp.]
MNWVDVALIAALCAASYSRNYWLMLLALVLCCLLREWGQWLIEAVFCVGAAGIALGLLIAWLAPASSVLMCLRFIRAEGWRGEKAIVASAPREAGKGFPLRPGRWLRVRVGEKDGEKEYPALMFALDDSPLAVGDEVEILHEIWEKYDEIS